MASAAGATDHQEQTSDVQSPSSWSSEIADLVRGVSGGMLFGVPLLYTMEVWWIGSHTTAVQTAVILVSLMVPLFALNLTEGFRITRSSSLSRVAGDTIESVALGIVVATLVLLLVREIHLGSPMDTSLGIILYEAAPFCLGIGVARHFLDGSGDGEEEGGSGGSSLGRRGELNATIADLGAATIGAAFIALSIAPTDEVPMIASRMGPAWLLLVMAASLAASYAIVFAAGFSRQSARHAQEGIFQRPLSETVASYLVALAVSAFLLWFFQRDIHPLSDLLSRVIVLGFPAAVGGAAGRLAI